MFSDLSNFDLLSVGITIAVSLFLGFAVYFSNRASITNKAFLFFTFISCIWGIFNYITYQLTDSDVSLYTIRIVMFSAVWQALTFFFLSHVFPREEQRLTKSFWLLFGIVSFVSLLTLTPYLFSYIVQSEAGLPPKVVPGPGVVAFGLTAISLVLAGIIELYRKRRVAQGIERKQFNVLLVGVAAMFSLIVTFNFLFPVLLSNSSFVPLGSIFVLPFLFATSYAIMRHKLLNAKIISTELIALLLVIFTFIEVIISKTGQEIILRSALFILLTLVSLILIKSVRQEVQQREQLQILTQQLEDANVQLKALDKARAEFISIASHQLRTPPATIKWYLAAVTAGDFGKVNPKAAEAIKKTEVTNNGLISLIDDLLNVSRIERGKMEFMFEPTDISHLVQAASDQLQPQAGIKKLKLVYEKPKGKMSLINADKEKLQQVVNNLIDNAIKYSQHGTIAVKLSKDGDKLKITVKDAGKGMDHEEIMQVFQKYGRGKDSLQHAAGLGLGMYVARIIVEHHHGKIWADSPGPGQGSVFTVLLPIHTNLSEEGELDLTKEVK